MPGNPCCPDVAAARPAAASGHSEDWNVAPIAERTTDRAAGRL